MRSSGSSVISQAYLNVPVKLHTVNNSSDGIRFNLINPKTKNKVKQQYVDSITDEPVSRSELVRGYEVARNSFLLFDKDEMKKLKSHLDGRISIQEYVDLDEINSIYFYKSYFLSVDKLNSKAYSLINKALSDLGVAAICLFSYRGKQHLSCIKAYKNILILQLFQYSEHTKSYDHVPVNETEYSDEELNLTKQLITSCKNKFDYESYQDKSKNHTLDLINEKLETEEIPELQHNISVNPHDVLATLIASLKKQENTKERKDK